jgi:hypothetical protein
MKENGTNRYWVAASSKYPPVVFTLGRKNVPKWNIIVGDDRAQVLWMEHVAGIPSAPVAKVTDEMLLGKDACLYRVRLDHHIDISSDVKTRTGIWSADRIVNGSAALKHLVKFAHTLLPHNPPQLTREQVEIVGDQVMRYDVTLVQAAIGRAMTAICGPMTARKPWTEPWLDPRHFMDLKEPNYRLHCLHATLVAWSHIYCNNVVYAEQMGLSSSRIQWLKGQTIDPKKVLKAIKILSAWKRETYDPLVCAFVVAAIWL